MAQQGFNMAQAAQWQQWNPQQQQLLQQQQQAQAQAQAQLLQQQQQGQIVAPRQVVPPQQRPQMNVQFMQQQMQQQMQMRQQQAAQQVPGGSFMVHTTGTDSDEVVIRTLVGEYVEKGANHGRKFYQKTTDKLGPDFVDVFLYYWDNRDGPAFEGWWFGNKLGGTQVWSHNASQALTPPNSAWKIPWDGAQRPTLVVQPKTEFVQQDSERKLATISTEATTVVKSAQDALQQTKQLIGVDPSDLASLQHAETLLTPFVQQLVDTQKLVADAQGSSQSPQLGQRCMQFQNQLRMTHAAVNSELQKLKTTKLKVEAEQKNKAIEDKDMVGYNEFMPEATEKTNTAEDLVEKAIITNELVTSAGEDMTEVRRAVDETEKAVNLATTKCGETRMFLNAKQAASRRFESERIKTLAETELKKLQMQLQAAQNKLNPLKTVRQDFNNRQNTQKMVTDILEKLNPAELDVDKAEESVFLLSTEDGLSEEGIANSEAAMAKASQALETTLKLLETKRKAPQAASQHAQAEAGKLEERIKHSQKRLAELGENAKGATEQVAVQKLVKEASAKVATVQEQVSKAADAEGPFLMGVEELPLDETLAVVKACEAAVTVANTSATIARMFIATKLAEAKRFTPENGAEASSKLKEVQQQFDNTMKRLTALKTNTATRKRKALAREADKKTAEAEKLAKEVGEAASSLGDEAKFSKLAATDVMEAAAATAKKEAQAHAAIADAQTFVSERQAEAKARSAPAETLSGLVKLLARLDNAKAKVDNYSKLGSSVEDRLAARRIAEEVATKIAAAEESVARVTDAVVAISEELTQLTSEAKRKQGIKDTEQAAQDAEAHLKQVSRYLAVKSRQDNPAKGDIIKLKPRLAAAQETLDQSVKDLKVRAEKVHIKAMVVDAEAKLREAETAVQKLCEAEAPLLKGDELPADEVARAISDIELAAKAAHTAVGGTKTLLATKRLAAKRMSSTALAAASKELEKLQQRLEAASKRMEGVRRNLSERKQANTKRELKVKMDAVEEKAKAAQDATFELIENATLKDANEMKGACEKISQVQQESMKEIDTVKDFFLVRQRELRSGGDATAGLVEEVEINLAKLSQLKDGIDRDRGRIRDMEHRFVSQKLVKDATEKVEALEKQGVEVTKLIKSLVSDKKEDNLPMIYMSTIVDLLQKHLSSSAQTPEALFDEMSKQKDDVDEISFTTFMQAHPALNEGDSAKKQDKASTEGSETAQVLLAGNPETALYNVNELTAVFQHLAKDASSPDEAPTKILKAKFLDQFYTKYICTTQVAMTDTYSVKGSKSLRKIAVNEVVMALGEPTKDASNGLTRVKARAEKDGKEGFVSISGNQGTLYLEAYSAHAAAQKQAEHALTEFGETVSTTLKNLEGKIAELSKVRSGPLEETRQHLQQLRPRVLAIDTNHNKTRVRVTDAKKVYAEAKDIEQRRRQEAIEKKAAVLMMEKCTAQANTLQETFEKSMPAVEALVKSKGADKENPLVALDEAAKEVETLLDSIKSMQETVASNMEAVKANSKGPLAEARSSLVKLKVKVGSFEQKCKKQITALRAAHKQLANDSHAAIVAALLGHVRQKKLVVAELFKELSKGEMDIKASVLREFLKGIPDVNLQDSQLDLGLTRYAQGCSKLSFTNVFNDFWECKKEVALTSEVSVKSSKTLRKLTVGEIVEVVEESKDETNGLTRVKCRVVSDLVEGWVTLKGNQGTTFLEKCYKPYYCSAEAVALQVAFESTSSDSNRSLRQDEVVEVLEGPRKEPPIEQLRMKGKAIKDDKQGWVTVKDASGTSNLEQVKLLICKQTTALTPNFDITKDKPIRKVEVGEALEPVGEETEDTTRNLTRIKVKATQDGVEGFLTLKGNQGTTYAEETDTKYICRRSVPIEARLNSGASLSAPRMLEVGETFEATEGGALKSDMKEGANRLKVRCPGDNSEGWLSVPVGFKTWWIPKYKCLKAGTSMSDVAAAEGGKEIRALAAAEVFEALDVPTFDGSVARVRLLAEKDGAIGYASVRGSDGAVLEPVAA